MKDFATHREIISQPAAWTAALQAVDQRAIQLRTAWQARPIEQVIFTGCGSTYYLSLAAASVFQALTDVPARGIPAGEFSLAPEVRYLTGTRPTLLVAVSRSGATTETLRAVEHFRGAGPGVVFTIGCNPDSKLAQMGDVNINIPTAREKSVVQTRSFASMCVAAWALGATLVQQGTLLAQLGRLSKIGQHLIASFDGRLQALADFNRFDRIYFLGSGLRYGLACEGSLKMKEMSLTHAEPFHFLEFRHGPVSMVTHSTLIVGLLSDDMHGEEVALLREVWEAGAHTLVLSESPVPSLNGDSVVLNSGLDEIARSILYMPPLQLLALGRALAKGLNPDQPRNLQAVVRLGDSTS
jgi:glucosamine--fructose-6-phosphate aminotransferase (isomerizing)